MTAELEIKLLTWMKEFVEVPHPSLGNWPPCPYARQARLNNKMSIVHSHFGNLVNDVETNLHLLDTKDVFVVMFDHTRVDAAMLSKLVKIYNGILMSHDYVILEDHPDALEYVNKVNMNFGHCGLLIVSKLTQLNTASTNLKAKGYYAHWDSHALDEVVNWRFT
jgi:hypothetical protein